MKDILKVFKALSDPTRLRIMMLLMEKELCVCELVFILKMEQSRISHQMRILRDADLVEDIRDGKWIIYRIPETIRESLKPLFGQYLKEKIKESRESMQDLENLKICLREEIRKKKLFKKS
jgi:ArsR family transcriptional regulator